jgi:lysophospholipase L1-like esterase
MWVGGRGNPAFRDHDARGYRNTVALQHADIVAIGDSHTYGIGVTREEAWPSILSAGLGLSVYSMAHAGYGPGQYERMLDEALSLRPRLIVVGLHLGNDLYDAYAFYKGQPVAPHLMDLAERAAAKDREMPIEAEAGRLFELGRRSPIRAWLGDNVELYRLAHAVRRQLAGPPALQSKDFETVVAALTPADRPYVSVFNDGDWRTILRPAYGRLGLNHRDPRIELGIERSFQALEAITARCRQRGVALVVVLLPTKESVVSPRVTSADAHLAELVADESRARERFTRWALNSDIPMLDALSALQASTAQPYPEHLDGHPNRVGHRVIAEMIAGGICKVVEWVELCARRWSISPASSTFTRGFSQIARRVSSPSWNGDRESMRIRSTRSATIALRTPDSTTPR